MNSAAFIIIAVLTLSAALAAATLPKLIHAALSFAIAFVGVAAFYFLLGAEFVGLVQVFVYIGAVAVLDRVHNFANASRCGKRSRL